jgi:hypothetical protein
MCREEVGLLGVVLIVLSMLLFSVLFPFHTNEKAASQSIPRGASDVKSVSKVAKINTSLHLLRAWLLRRGGHSRTRVHSICRPDMNVCTKGDVVRCGDGKVHGRFLKNNNKHL